MRHRRCSSRVERMGHGIARHRIHHADMATTRALAAPPCSAGVVVVGQMGASGLPWHIPPVRQVDLALRKTCLETTMLPSPHRLCSPSTIRLGIARARRQSTSLKWTFRLVCHTIPHPCPVLYFPSPSPSSSFIYPTHPHALLSICAITSPPFVHLHLTIEITYLHLMRSI